MTNNQDAATAGGTGLNPRAEAEIGRTFNSLTNSYATVPEYIAHYFPGSSTWPGDACGCTDDRCTGHHHDGADCGCLEVQLNEFHLNLSVAWKIREWFAQYGDQASALGMLEALDEHSRDIRGSRTLEERLTDAQRAAFEDLYSEADYLDQYDFIRAVHHVGVDVLQQRPASPAA